MEKELECLHKELGRLHENQTDFAREVGRYVELVAELQNYIAKLQKGEKHGRKD